MQKEIKAENKIDINTIDKPNKDIYKSINDIKIKLFIDNNIWDKTKKELNPEYEEKTKWLYEN